ncbi:hypothetical protein PIB30_055479 [Stylosanthes scabra]|uniref:Uncharacterized protein n=1 Tax=Stylosanthes scabra TaxID=79078 RepID=A0ABU6SJM9_9FABA|nr:hypothetical protein [Stylosanthes scabra]
MVLYRSSMHIGWRKEDNGWSANLQGRMSIERLLSLTEALSSRGVHGSDPIRISARMDPQSDSIGSANVRIGSDSDPEAKDADIVSDLMKIVRIRSRFCSNPI